MITASEQDGRKTVTVSVLGREFTFYNSCSHLPSCDLSKGTVDGSTIICNCGWQYDLLTGRAVNQPVARIERIE